MAIINLKEKKIQVKIVYYGPGRSGKTTNLRYIFKKLQEKYGESLKSNLISIDTKGERTLFLDFLPVGLGQINGLDLNLQLYTTPGQVIYESTRKLVLRGVDGVVFVADSLATRKEANVESYQNLLTNLKEYGLTTEDIGLAFQWNKQDLQEKGIPVMDAKSMEDLLQVGQDVPTFSASALQGTNVLKTLNIVAKLTVSKVLKKMIGIEG
ncbi:MAG: gliding motility protein [Verrucomicrobiae bacterium]|nr:gliding motility protein [Verrucomicrobiae bacterium]